MTVSGGTWAGALMCLRIHAGRACNQCPVSLTELVCDPLTHQVVSFCICSATWNSVIVWEQNAGLTRYTKNELQTGIIMAAHMITKVMQRRTHLHRRLNWQVLKGLDHLQSCLAPLKTSARVVESAWTLPCRTPTLNSLYRMTSYTTLTTSLS